MDIRHPDCLSEENLTSIAKHLGNKFTSLRIFTGDSTLDYPTDGQLYYRIEAIHPDFDEPFVIEKHDQWFEICSCKECSRYDKDLWEYYSIFLGLKSAHAKFPVLPVSLFVDSKSFLSDAADGFYHPDRTHCSTENQFMKEFFKLLWDVGLGEDGDVRIFRNK